MGDQIVFPARAPRHDDNGVQSLVQARVSDAFLPIILTAPHGGKEATGDQVSYLEARPEFEKNIRIVADVGTAQLLEAIDAQLLLKTGHACFSVVARFHRKFIDANRDFRDPEAIAFVPGCDRARDIYDAYHGWIDRAVARLVASHRSGRVLLLDIHGQCAFNDHVLIGTRNGETANLQYLEAESEGFLWHLRQTLGQTILPGRGQRELEGYTGGYTVHRHCGLAVDAVQLEFGSSWRRSATERAKIAEKVSQAILHYLQPLIPFFASINDRSQPTWATKEQKARITALQKLGITTPRQLVDALNQGILNPKLELSAEEPLSDAVISCILKRSVFLETQS